MKKLFIGHFGTDSDYWFLSWSDNEKEAIEIIEKELGKPRYIKDISKETSSIISFKPVNVSKNKNPYYLFEPILKKFKFKNDEFIQKLIYEQKNSIKNSDLKREKFRNLIEEENKNQKKLEENEYNKIIKKIDEIGI